MPDEKEFEWPQRTIYFNELNGPVKKVADREGYSCVSNFVCDAVIEEMKRRGHEDLIPESLDSD
jgi:hypothetical protein